MNKNFPESLAIMKNGINLITIIWRMMIPEME
jgi:hypothetical protein